MRQEWLKRLVLILIALPLILCYSAWAQIANDQPSEPIYSASNGIPADVPSVIEWVKSTHDHGGRPFAIADKNDGKIYIVNPDGRIVDESPALYGKNRGDHAGIGKTPAGAYTFRFEETQAKGYGGDVLVFYSDSFADYALHRVYKLVSAERRVARLQSATPADNRISNGCINVPDDFYNHYLQGMGGSRIYILPDQTTTFFPYLNPEPVGVIRNFVPEEPDEPDQENPRPRRGKPVRTTPNDPLRYW